MEKLSILKGKDVKSSEDEVIHRFLQKKIKNYGNTAIIYEDEKGEEILCTYEELDCATNKLARTLRKLTSPRNEANPIVAVSMRPTEKLIIILLSILKAGMAYLPLDVEFPRSRVKHILDESEALVVVIDEGDEIIHEETPVFVFNELLKNSANESDEFPEFNAHPEDLALILYTSGSTGVPKGVKLSHTSIMNRLQWQWQEFPFMNDEKRCIFKTTLTFVDSTFEIWGSLLQGRTIIIVPKPVIKDPEKFIHQLEKHKIQRLLLVPSLLRSMLMYLDLQVQKKSERLKSLRLWICTGEELPHSLAAEFFERFSPLGHSLANFYGCTEVTGDATYHLLNDASQLRDSEKVPIGIPLHNCIIYIVSKELQLLPAGDIGELLVAGRNVAPGYIRNRDPHKFIKNPYTSDPEYSRIYRTGDYARIVDGIVMFEGRTDSQIKIRGHRVDLVEVEKSLRASPTVDKAVVLCYKPGELSQALIAFVTIKTGNSTSGLEIERFLKQKLQGYMVPQVIIVDDIPLLINGKTDRQTLLQMYEKSHRSRDGKIIACDFTSVPNDEIEKANILFSTVASVIGKSLRFTVDMTANFYELGGNSLNSIYTIRRLEEQGYKIRIDDFLRAKDMREMLQKMHRVSEEEEDWRDDSGKMNFKVEMLSEKHRTEAIRLVSESFYSKGHLEKWLISDVKTSDYPDLLNAIWDPLLEKGLSFVIKSQDKKNLLGVAMNFDAFDGPELKIAPKLAPIYDLVDQLEIPIKETKLPVGKGKVLHAYLSASDPELPPGERVIIMNELETQVIKLAKEKKFVGVFATNTNTLTQQLAVDVHGYEVLLDYQVNQYVAPDGSKPFDKAPDDQRALCCWKSLK